ncbi:MetQ/NlpA family ABC transporter substrate-binding protein [Enterococcus raffinosus]|uniref:Lipoprotein n=1 Tax=Enterococcus raffinosus TaxID=71452 RepID=A0AAW8SS12_9ENTE|nr:MetQ/NlpA family ABC transporter substrate-binding protein [Enterococcus raffinosus]MBS6430975.1 MetQ/NlpA family ABC transporter substrate-binding protein [Enterococcus raffinosus]MDK7989049.1 MetQ/NlpA family ABC transporter substrate-binding protein [Enterococcus raffinosus]MDT2536838.1 MetQ/NlpA family ABC transporter substrate-binding protein [Enterococcus raffinosus]MDT2570474.1 MetQ/NlpA family ABC transporter substrate-binding protein [Enterococcus raffinosus]OJG79791.1 D-methionine
MKRKAIYLASLLTVILILTGCSKASTSEKKEDTLVIGTLTTPHGEILEHVKPLLEKEGVTLEIKNFDDYILPNKALADEDIDVNYFQHVPFFEQAIKENEYKFANAGAVHVEPMGLYSKKINSLDELKNGATIITSNSVSDWGRIITILQKAGLVKVKEGINLETASFDDIAENPKNLKFEHSIDPSLLTSAYTNEEGDLVAINANFAYQAKLNPVKDAILLEEDNSPYGNIIAVREEDKNDPRIKKLTKILHNKEVQNWILKKWDGSVKPVSLEKQAGE